MLELQCEEIRFQTVADDDGIWTNVAEEDSLDLGEGFGRFIKVAEAQAAKPGVAIQNGVQRHHNLIVSATE